MTDLDELRAELDDFAKPEKKRSLSAKEERIIAGFEEIQRFVDVHGKKPEHGEDKDIFERLYSVRLQRLLAQEECRTLLAPFDHQGLLTPISENTEANIESLNDEALLAELEGLAGPSDITQLKHVKSLSDREKERQKSDEIGRRKVCTDFENFRPIFESVQADLQSGARRTIPFDKDGSIEKDNFFIISGQIAFIADVGEAFKGKDGRNEYRLRVIFDNGVESNQLMHSLQKRLWEDDTGRRITDISMGPLFEDHKKESLLESGTIYVLRSQSQHPFVAEHHKLIHKIGVTGGKVEARIANAAQDATYMLSEVEVVATYKLSGINRTKLEKLLHRIFAAAQIDITIEDRFGNPVRPREWFLVPLSVIDEAVDAIKDGSIMQLIYDPTQAKLVKQPG
jgi:hypothetical protein